MFGLQSEYDSRRNHERDQQCPIKNNPAQQELHFAVRSQYLPKTLSGFHFRSPIPFLNLVDIMRPVKRSENGSKYGIVKAAGTINARPPVLVP
jgi:hypothetical protein